MDLHDRIKKARKEKGFTQKKLAEISGIAVSSIINYETEKRMPPADILAKLAYALGVTSDYLLYGDLTPFMKENALDLPDTMTPEEIAAQRAKQEASVKKHFAIADKREGFIATYDTLNDRGKEKTIDYVEDLSKVDEYRKGAKP